MQQGYKKQFTSSSSADQITCQTSAFSLNVGEESSEGKKVQSSAIVNVWDFIGDSDAESVGASSTQSPIGDGCSQGFPSEYDFGEEVASENFEEPCEPVSTSGGTAAFYHVKYRSGQEPPGYALNHFVGKDLSHASDELEFYDSLRVAVDKDSRYSNFAEMCMDNPGVAKLICKNPKDKTMQVRHLLLLENLWNGYDKMRLVDVKMGAETSVAGWKGKSRVHAWKNARVDQRTNSLVEGFRLEGMECPPRPLKDRIDSVEVQTGNKMRSKIMSNKAAKRFLLQRLRGHEFLASWCDVSQLGAGAEVHAQTAVWSAIDQVGKLLRLCADIPVPQQWIGSSIAMAIEVGKICKNPNVKVKVFDWGRAELSSIEHHNQLTMEQRKDRLRFWRQYIRAVSRFYWELCRISAHRCCCPAWTAFVFELRIEPVSIVRAALRGKTVSEVRGISLFQLPTTGIKGGSASVVLPLLPPKGVATATKTGNSSKIGELHIRISAPEDRRCGEGSVIIEVNGATNLPNDLDHSGAAITVVRVIGFERVGDARMHCDKYRGGHPEPTPRGRAYALSTVPGKIVAGTMVWESPFEFIGLGDEARRAQARLEEALPEIFSDGPVTTPKTDKEDSPSPWPEMMPPTVGDQSQVESVSQVFGEQLISWLNESAPLPPGWP